MGLVMRVLVNICYGGFGIQNVVLGELGLGPTYEEVPEYLRQDNAWWEAKRRGLPVPEAPLVDKYKGWIHPNRTHPGLIDRVMPGESVGGRCAQLAVVEFDDVFVDFADHWKITEYDGLEDIKLD